MVIASNDSCGTLVSFDEGVKKVEREIRKAFEEQTFRRTELLLPEENFQDYDDDDYWCMPPPKVEQHVYVPENSMDAVDMCLRSIPQVMETADELLANPPRHFSCKSRERVLYVGQGEMAHAVPSQCDVIVSDKATTCHILALRSKTCSSSPLVSLAHIDGPCYEDSIREMIAEHKSHHGQLFFDSSEEEKKEEIGQERIEMDVHMVGGFEDAKGSSREISTFLINLLARVAHEERTTLRMTLKTCAISSMNDNGYSCPIGRGMGIDLRTGEVFLAKVDDSAAGPALTLRSVRLWGSRKQLSLIHTARSNKLVVAPFHFQPFLEIDMLLKLPDSVLLQCTSTSPDVEEDDFCDNIRKSLRFMLNHKSHEIFVQPLFFCREDSSSNLWKQC